LFQKWNFKSYALDEIIFNFKKINEHDNKSTQIKSKSESAQMKINNGKL